MKTSLTSCHSEQADIHPPEIEFSVDSLLSPLSPIFSNETQAHCAFSIGDNILEWFERKNIKMGYPESLKHST